MRRSIARWLFALALLSVTLGITGAMVQNAVPSEAKLEATLNSPTSVSVTGIRFASSSSLDLHFTATDLRVYSRADTNSAGRFRISLNLPHAVKGELMIEAIDHNGKSATFTITGDNDSANGPHTSADE